MKDALLLTYREEILRLVEARGAKDPRVFGSRARGDARASSDVDLLVSFPEGSSLLDLIGLKQEVEDLIHVPVEVISDRGISPYLEDQILAEAVPL